MSHTSASMMRLFSLFFPSFLFGLVGLVGWFGVLVFLLNFVLGGRLYGPRVGAMVQRDKCDQDACYEVYKESIKVKQNKTLHYGGKGEKVNPICRTLQKSLKKLGSVEEWDLQKSDMDRGWPQRALPFTAELFNITVGREE